ncbi:unnamed protein product [Prunus armeniaca]
MHTRFFVIKKDENLKPQLTSYHYTFYNLELGAVANHEDLFVAIGAECMQRLEENLLLRSKDCAFLEG